MSAVVHFRRNTASAAQIAEHLGRCDADFVPPLSARVDIGSYAEKIASKAMRFEAWADGLLLGLVAAYCNDREHGIAYITSVSVLKAWTGQGIAARLLDQCVEHALASGLQRVSLEVASDNAPAINLYEKSGFVAGRTGTPYLGMDIYLNNGPEYEQHA